ncbi:Rpn family recombination-promoting nuclease/putative transposase [Desertifilum sp. FACHB-1129]|uniref:DUF4351 domain-containing protein n=1 Tax=Desertifilum tharense IPPAS B-1220 TaxID=1781255 RepID=A0A1E5QJV5_9CYAN|nr:MULTISPECIES: Rpn family recombination-promoting nuclease/putative transposase [Desertifilum]MDA0210934.1 Rpn family recombination-promoting nuclease/putative transposase [Cyanobacteria bacterium FC1]MBD2313463.1 Rpn family recombination-promoting nuclease/putative transposase [Desertifilum sp. FACHB-1129]MBD2322333.1 Rpn family recombination-promoting nuclease/putative transposase [Desertifilum sp. FACHB-866]MBD2332495.1 Rpn family recombination-promoting nuclease/putative transposase [Dese
MFDNICKFLAENFSSDFATWLLGESIPLTELSPSELSLEPIRADALILQQSEQLVLHLEFQTEPNPDIPFRMADYRLRVYRRFPQKQMRQVVIYLQRSRSERVYQTAFTLERTRHEFDAIRLWEQPTDIFLGSPGLIPFAVLSQSSDRTQVLQQAIQVIDTISDRRIQSNVAAATAVLAGLVLEKTLIQQLLRRELMQESVIYQDIRQEEALSLVRRLLKRKLGAIPDPLQVKIQALSLVQLEEFAEALLDFTSVEDVSQWLQET